MIAVFYQTILILLFLKGYIILDKFLKCFPPGPLTGSQFLEGGYWEIGGDKIKSGIFNNKKKLWIKTFFFVITKNLNWEIWTKSLVTFKRWMRLRMKNLNIMGVHWKI